MASYKGQRNEWHQQNGKWARSLGERGIRVRLFQRRKAGVFYREVWRAGAGKDRRSLETTDRREAERRGRLLLAALLQQDETPAEGPVSLQYVLDRYRRECPDYLDNKPHSKLEMEGRTAVLIGYFGADRDVRTLSAIDVQNFTRKRFDGGIIRSTGTVTDPVRARTVHADLSFWSTVLRWASTADIGGGRRLLRTHPLLGIRFPREKNPRRPVATWERFEATRLALQALARDAEDDSERMLWIRVELALVLMEATGRRRGSIRQLAWEDFDSARGEIRWRAETDKKGREWITPVPEALLPEVRTFQRQLGALGGWLFPSLKHPSQPIGGTCLSRLIRRAEEKAELPKLRGGLCHPYRRKWATERKHLPLKDVAAAGGWKDVNTILRCYQHEDRETMLKVMSESRKVTNGTAIGG